MTWHEEYRGYKIFSLKNQVRLYIDGPGISCNDFWYSMKNAKEHIDFTIKIILRGINK